MGKAKGGGDEIKCIIVLERLTGLWEEDGGKGVFPNGALDVEKLQAVSGNSGWRDKECMCKEPCFGSGLYSEGTGEPLKVVEQVSGLVR